MNHFRLAGLSLLTVILQGSFFTHFPIGGATLHLAIPFIVNVGIYVGPLPASICGAVIGLIEDISTGNAIGVRGLLYFWIGYFAGVMKDQVNDDDARPAVLISVGATFVFFILYAFISRFMSHTGGFLLYLKGPLVIEALLNGLMAWVLHIVLRRVLRLPRLYS